MRTRDRTAALAVLAGVALGSSILLVSHRPGDTGVADPRIGAAEALEPTCTPDATRPAAPGSRTPTPGLPDPAPDRADLDGVRPGVPIRVQVPSVPIDAAVTPIRALSDGVLVPPGDYTTVGWWADGARPGSDHGTVLVTGHTVSTGGGVFDDLDTIRVGDRVLVQKRGRDLEYVVRSVRSYRTGRLATLAPRLFDQSGPPRLALVTCHEWTGERYLGNVVAMAAGPRPVLPDQTAGSRK